TIAAARVIKVDAGPVAGLTVAPNGAQVFTGGADKQITQWNTSSGAKERTVAAPAALSAVDLSKNNALLAVASTDKVVRLFNFADGKEIKSVSVPAVVRSLAFSPNNATL